MLAGTEASGTVVVEVAVSRPLRKTLSYLPPEEGIPQIGSRVKVPLGKQSTTGLALAVKALPQAVGEEQADNGITLKAITQTLDDAPFLDAHLLEFLDWAARYYHHPVGEVCFTALPVLLRKSKPLAARYQPYLQDSTLPAAPVVQTDTKPALQLTDEQEQCLQQLSAWSETSSPHPVLLHGITGSGKTEIYLRLILPVLEAGRQVLVLVPEIGLTPQLVARFEHFFVDHVVVCLHSGLNDGERLQAWLQARSRQAAVVIGTRSTVFTPLPRLGLIVVDEEHDASFKQQEGFRYHGRDLAIKRAQMLGVAIILGSATPALETLHNVQAGRYHYFHLSRRPGSARPPELRLQDIRAQPVEAGLSADTLRVIQQTLNRGEQAMVFLNRRGFAPTLFCSACGWHAACEHCSVNMTWHMRRNRLLCHHCGAEQATPQQCPACGRAQLATQGQGTERVELFLQQRFADYPVIRIDRDSTSRKGVLEDKLSLVRGNEPLVLVGTQMLAKGHDFPNLTLVVIVDADQSLLSADYRALERFGQLLVQVAGRAGRAEKPGQVILQTTQPEHPALLQLLGQGYLPFARQLLEERQRWRFPPFGYHALIRADAASMEKAFALLEKMRQFLHPTQGKSVTILGPAPAPLEKRAGRYRAQLLLQARQRSELHGALDVLIKQERHLPARGQVRWSVDVDPMDLL